MTFIQQPPHDGKPHEVFYRYYEVVYSAGTDEWGDPLPGAGRLAVELMEIPVIKRTPCGAWIGWFEDEKRFVNLNRNKCYALPTIAEARASFIARKKRQAQIMAARMRHAERALSIAQTMWAKDRAHAR